MSESNLAYNNDGSMNTSADYLGKFLQYIYNDFAVEKWPIGQSGQLRSLKVIKGHSWSKHLQKHVKFDHFLRFIDSNCNQNFHFLTLTGLVLPCLTLYDLNRPFIGMLFRFVS